MDIDFRPLTLHFKAIYLQVLTVCTITNGAIT